MRKKFTSFRQVLKEMQTKENWFLFFCLTHVVILTSCISSSVIVHLDQSFSQNALSRYEIVSLEIVLILVPAINFMSLVH